MPLTTTRGNRGGDGEAKRHNEQERADGRGREKRDGEKTQKGGRWWCWGGEGVLQPCPIQKRLYPPPPNMRRSNDLMQEIHNACISFLYPPGLLRFLPRWILPHLIKKALFHKQVGLVKQSSKATEQQRLIPKGAVKEKTKEVEAQKRK